MSEPPPASAPFTGSAQDYRERATVLLEAARTARPEAVAALQAEALEWRKLAIEADWQEAVQSSLDVVDRSLTERADNEDGPCR